MKRLCTSLAIFTGLTVECLYIIESFMEGLLPAVVESWYPNSNHSYGLLLEDDVELSPLFYAWIKMTILRYRWVMLPSIMDPINT